MNNRCLFGGISHRFEFWHKPGHGLLGLTSNVKTSSWFQWQFLWIMWSGILLFSYCDEIIWWKQKYFCKIGSDSFFCVFVYLSIRVFVFEQKMRKIGVRIFCVSSPAKEQWWLNLTLASGWYRPQKGRALLLGEQQLSCLLGRSTYCGRVYCLFQRQLICWANWQSGESLVILLVPASGSDWDLSFIKVGFRFIWKLVLFAILNITPGGRSTIKKATLWSF